jgi:short-subunit dehydrogenase
MQCSKFALEGFTEGFAKEMHPDWNIRFLIAEPGGVKTKYADKSLSHSQRHPAYTDPGCPYNQLLAYLSLPNAGSNWAESDTVVRVLYEVIMHEETRPLPTRLPLGSDSWGMIKADVEATKKSLEDWADVSNSCSSKEQLQSIDFLK